MSPPRHALGTVRTAARRAYTWHISFDPVITGELAEERA